MKKVTSDKTRMDRPLPLGWNILEKKYTSFSKKASELTIEQSKRLAKKNQTLLTNYTYVLYEYLEKKITRDIDYMQVKKFAIKNRGFVEYMFKGMSVLQKLPSWLHENVDIVTVSMFDGRTNKFNKNRYH